jgi:hypothetical protein
MKSVERRCTDHSVLTRHLWISEYLSNLMFIRETSEIPVVRNTLLTQKVYDGWTFHHKFYNQNHS